MDVRTACLGILSRGDRTGYEIKKLFEEGPFSHFWYAGFGSIYPALSELCAAGLASMREIEHKGRRRKLYCITEAGRRVFLDALLHPPGPDRCRSDWLFMAYFGELLPPDLLARRISERLDFYRRELAEMDANAAGDLDPGQAFVLSLGRAVYAAAVDCIEHEAPRLLHLAEARDVAAE